LQILNKKSLKAKDIMLHINSKGLVIGLTALVALGTFTFFLSNGVAEEASKVEERSESLLAPSTTVDVIALMKDHVLGRDDAPVTIIEYASMTCSHCAHFATQILPEVKKRLIDTGKARLIFRDFPLDNFALKASMMTRCAPDNKYFNLVEVVFSNQERWTKAKDPMESLAQLGSLAGIDAEKFKSCTENKALETALLGGLQKAQTDYRIQSTPTFIFNEGAEQFSGAQEIEKFEETVNKLTKGK
jgi:protein-disulfide isomerase